MSELKLLAIQKVLDIDQDWTNMLIIACELEGLEYTRDMAVKITYNLRDKIELKPDHSVDYNSVTDEMILEEVRKHIPQYPPSLTAALIAKHDPTFSDRVRAFCVELGYPYSTEFELSVAENLASNDPDNIQIRGMDRISTLDVTEKQFETNMKDVWEKNFQTSELDKEKNDGGYQTATSSGASTI